MNEQAIYVAVDAANLHCRCQNGCHVNYAALLTLARKLGNVCESAIYVPLVGHTERERDSLRQLKEAGFRRVISRPLRVRPDGSRKSDIDVAMAIDLWEAGLHKRMDAVMLVSGDGDFIPLVDRLVQCDIDVYVVGPDDHTARDLVIASTCYVPTSAIENLFQDGPAERPRDLAQFLPAA